MEHKRRSDWRERAPRRLSRLATAIAAHTNFADRNMEIHFFKNIAMAGGFAYVAAFGGGAYSFDALIGRRRGQP